MTEKTARAEDAAAPPEANPSAAQQQSDAAALAAELKDRLLRTLAEMENLRKRTEREVTDARLYGVASFARDILGVADNMRRAPAGSVVEVVAPGYMIGERVLRPAMVGVSKGGPKTAPASRAVNDNATADAGKDS